MSGPRPFTFRTFVIAIATLLASSCSSGASSAPALDGTPVVTAPPSADDAGVPDAAQPDTAPPAPRTYTNPVFRADFADPFVLRDEARYYAFATNANGRNVRAATSNDLSTWTELPDALPVLPAWAMAHASLTWAPSVLRRGSSFVLYYTARSIAAGFQCIGRAVAATAAGPYVDDSADPFICQVTAPQALCGSIDPSPFVDENGDAYLLWKSDENATACGGDARLWIQRLGVDGISLLDAPMELLKRDRSWEAPLIEGPSMVKSGDRYFLFYSANWWESPNYGIGYAICSTPHGPCSKKTLDAPLVQSTGDALGPGGQELFTDVNGKLWMAYHAWSAPIVGYTNGGARSLRIDRLDLASGKPLLAGPSTTPRPL
jgi:beta-xylosidase